MMRKKLLILFLLLFVASCSFLNKKEDEEPKIKTVTGRIYFMGNEEVTDIGLDAFTGRSYALIAADKETKRNIHDLQGRVVTVKGYIDTVAMYPMLSVHVEEFTKIDPKTVSGKLIKSGMGGRAKFYLQNKEKTYNIVTDRFIEVGNLVGRPVEINGYVYEVDDSVEHIYLLNIDKIEM